MQLKRLAVLSGGDCAGDKIVDIRTASRENPGVKGGSLSLSMSYGVQVILTIPLNDSSVKRWWLGWLLGIPN